MLFEGHGALRGAYKGSTGVAEVYNVARRVPDRQEAEDVTAEVFAVASDAAGGLDRSGPRRSPRIRVGQPGRSADARISARRRGSALVRRTYPRRDVHRPAVVTAGPLGVTRRRAFAARTCWA